MISLKYTYVLIRRWVMLSNSDGLGEHSHDIDVVLLVDVE